MSHIHFLVAEISYLTFPRSTMSHLRSETMFTYLFVCTEGKFSTH